MIVAIIVVGTLEGLLIIFDRDGTYLAICLISIATALGYGLKGLKETVKCKIEKARIQNNGGS